MNTSKTFSSRHRHAHLSLIVATALTGLGLTACGGARGEDVLRLAKAIQQSVQAMFGVALEPEPVML